MANIRRATRSLLRSTAVCAAMLTCASNAWAQSSGPSQGERGTQARQYSMLFGGTIPQGDFKQNVTGAAFSADFDVLLPIGRSPIFVGTGFGAAIYGSTPREAPFSSTFPDITVRTQTDNVIFTGNLLLRAQPRSGRIRPYIEGLIGFNDLSTDTTLTITNKRANDGLLVCLWDVLFGAPCDNDNAKVSSTVNNLNDGALSYGVGAGAQLELPMHEQKYWVSLDSRVRYVHGGNADYLRKGSIRWTNGAASFDKLSSRTDVITAQVGLTVHF